MQRLSSFPTTIPSNPPSPLGKSKSFYDLPIAVQTSWASSSFDLNQGSVCGVEESPSRLVRPCKHCNFPFRIRSMSGEADFCSKDCETCYTIFTPSQSPSTVENNRKAIFEFQQQLLQQETIATDGEPIQPRMITPPSSITKEALNQKKGDQINENFNLQPSGESKSFYVEDKMAAAQQEAKLMQQEAKKQFDKEYFQKISNKKKQLKKATSSDSIADSATNPLTTTAIMSDEKDDYFFGMFKTRKPVRPQLHAFF